MIIPPAPNEENAHGIKTLSFLYGPFPSRVAGIFTVSAGNETRAGYALWSLQQADWKPNEVTGYVSGDLVHDQKAERWPSNENRPPTESSAFTTTYRALKGVVAQIRTKRNRRSCLPPIAAGSFEGGSKSNEGSGEDATQSTTKGWRMGPTSHDGERRLCNRHRSLRSLPWWRNEGRRPHCTRENKGLTR
jgi:hypothetical protein